MTAPAYPHTISLGPCAWAAWTEVVEGAWRALRRRWQVYAEWRAAAAAQRQLAALDPRTLRDIGAAEGLVGLHRWQEEVDGRGWHADPQPMRW